MGKLVAGYGSEWHLLRFLGRHRDCLDAAILKETGGTAVNWLDFPFSRKVGNPDLEWTGIGFIQDRQILSDWVKFWPTSGTAQNWDAVGTQRLDKSKEWLLVEAKAHLEEISSSCAAVEHGGLPLIRSALDETKAALGVDSGEDWLNGYYQYANRLACLHFLNLHRIPARLVMLYFVGNEQPGTQCPVSEAGWAEALQKQDAHLGILPNHPLADRVNKVFIDVAG